MFRRFRSGIVNGFGGVIVMSGWGGWGVGIFFLFLSFLSLVVRMVCFR